MYLHLSGFLATCSSPLPAAVYLHLSGCLATCSSPLPAAVYLHLMAASPPVPHHYQQLCIFISWLPRHLFLTTTSSCVSSSHGCLATCSSPLPAAVYLHLMAASPPVPHHYQQLCIFILVAALPPVPHHYQQLCIFILVASSPPVPHHYQQLCIFILVAASPPVPHHYQQLCIFISWLPRHLFLTTTSSCVSSLSWLPRHLFLTTTSSCVSSSHGCLTTCSSPLPAAVYLHLMAASPPVPHHYQQLCIFILVAASPPVPHHYQQLCIFISWLPRHLFLTTTSSCVSSS